jgi:hypothetical protein
MDDNKPAINKNIYQAPKNPSKLKNSRFNNKSVSKEKEKVYNESLIKTNKKVKNPSMNKKFTSDSKDDLKALKLAGILLAIFGGLVILAVFFFGMSKSDNNFFKGEKYFNYLGIDATSAFNEKLDNKYNLVKTDNYYAGTFTYEDESYYRFEVENQGEKSYDMEISSLQCNVSEEDNLNTGYVEVFKRTYKATSGDYSGKNVDVFYYKLHVPKGGIKKFE